MGLSYIYRILVLGFIFLFPSIHADHLLRLNVTAVPGCSTLCPSPRLHLTLIDGAGKSVHRWNLDKDVATATPIKTSSVEVIAEIETPDQDYPSLTRPCGLRIKISVDSSTTERQISCWKVNLFTGKGPKSAGLQTEHPFWTEWTNLLPIAITLIALICCLFIWLYQKRKVRSFQVLFEEHLIQSAHAADFKC